MAPELECRILDEFNESDEEPPWVWPVDNQSLKQDAGDLLLYGLGVGLREQVEKAAREVVGV